MSDLIWLSRAQMRRIEPYFPLSHGVPRVDDRRVLSGIVFVIRNGLRWRDAPKEYGPHKTIYNRFIRWSRLGVFNRIFAELAAKGPKPERLMIDATHLTALNVAVTAVGVVVIVGWFQSQQIEEKLHSFSVNELQSLHALVISAMDRRPGDTKNVAIGVFNDWFHGRNTDSSG